MTLLTPSTVSWPTALFERPASANCLSGDQEAHQTLNSQISILNFHPLPDTPLKPLVELFRAKLINLLILIEEKLPEPDARHRGD